MRTRFAVGEFASRLRKLEKKVFGEENN